MEMDDKPNDDDLLAADLTGTAYHEVGHVVMNLHYGTVPDYIMLEKLLIKKPQTCSF